MRTNQNIAINTNKGGLREDVREPHHSQHTLLSPFKAHSPPPPVREF